MKEEGSAPPPAHGVGVELLSVVSCESLRPLCFSQSLFGMMRAAGSYLSIPLTAQFSCEFTQMSFSRMGNLLNDLQFPGPTHA